jgi:hypothetical protein
MLRHCLVVLALAAAAGQARAGWADGMFDELSRDFGSVPRGQVLSHPFRLVNNTKDKVTISSVRVSCGCVSARALQTTLAPGQETAILAQMDTRRFSNTKNVTIFVTFSSPRFEEVRLWVQANSREDVSFSAETLAFGRIKRGNTPAQEMTVSFLGGNNNQIVEAKCDSNYIESSFQELKRDTGEVSYQIKAKLRGDTPAGKWYTDIWLKTNNPSMPRLRVPVTVEVEAALSITPGIVALGQVKNGTETDRKVIISGIKAFRVTGFTGTDNELKIRPSSNESKTVHVLTVTLRPSHTGEVNRVVRVQTDMKSGGEIEFATQAQVVP